MVKNISKNAKAIIDSSIKTIEMNAYAFIVPESLVSIPELATEDARIALSSVTELNGLVATEDARYVHLWFHNDGSENIASHGHRNLGCKPRNLYWVPCELLNGIKEGDTFTFITPQKSMDGEPFILELTVTCQQQGSRYEHRGLFHTFMEELHEHADSKDDEGRFSDIRKTIELDVYAFISPTELDGVSEIIFIEQELYDNSNSIHNIPGMKHLIHNEALESMIVGAHFSFDVDHPKLENTTITYNAIRKE